MSAAIGAVMRTQHNTGIGERSGGRTAIIRMLKLMIG